MSSITPLGISLAQVVGPLVAWAKTHQPEIAEARERFDTRAQAPEGARPGSSESASAGCRGRGSKPPLSGARPPYFELDSRSLRVSTAPVFVLTSHTACTCACSVEVRVVMSVGSSLLGSLCSLRSLR